MPTPASAPWVSRLGKAYSAWSAAWWPWAIGQPTGSDPRLDPTGQYSRGRARRTGHLPGRCVEQQYRNPELRRASRRGAAFPRKRLQRRLFTALFHRRGVHGFERFAETLGFTVTAVGDDRPRPVQNLDPARPIPACAGPIARCTAPGFHVNLPAENPFGASQRDVRADGH